MVPPLKTALICKEKNNTIKKKVNSGNFKYKINEIIQIADPKLWEKLEKAQAVIVDDIDENTKKTIISLCLDKEIPYITRPSYQDIILKESGCEQFGDLMMLIAKTRGLNIIERAFKRTLDIIISAIGLIITSPIILFAAIKIKKQDKGKIFFIQQRLTRDGKTFNCYKLRTMIPQVEVGAARLLSCFLVFAQ